MFSPSFNDHLVLRRRTTERERCAPIAVKTQHDASENHFNLKGTQEVHLNLVFYLIDIIWFLSVYLSYKAVDIRTSAWLCWCHILWYSEMWCSYLRLCSNTWDSRGHMCHREAPENDSEQHIGGKEVSQERWNYVWHNMRYFHSFVFSF